MLLKRPRVRLAATMLAGATAIFMHGWHAGPARAEGQAGAADPQLAQLRQQVAALERRIADLEKSRGGGSASAGDTSAQDARLKQVEQRLGALERKPEASKESEHALDVREGGTTIVAPFTVVDESGKPIVRVTAGGQYSRGMYLYGAGAIGSGTYVGVEADGSGRIYVARAGHLPEALLAVTSQGPIFQLSNEGKPMTSWNKESLWFVGTGGNTVALVGTKGRAKGYLELNDASGAVMVEAGMLDAHKGYVLANPWKTSTAVTGDPSVLKGGSGK